MARKYSNNIVLPTGIKLSSPIPVDDRMVVASLVELVAEDTWKSGSNYLIYKGIAVSVQSENALYIYTGADNDEACKNLSNWKKIGSADGSVYSYKGSKQNLNALAAEVLANGAQAGDVYNILSSFTLTNEFTGQSSQTYPAGTNVAFRNSVAAGSGTWLNEVDPLGGTTTGLLTANDVNGKLVTDTQKAKLDMMSDATVTSKFDTDLLTLKNGATNSTVMSLLTKLNSFRSEPLKLHFLKADGVMVKIEVSDNTDSSYTGAVSDSAVITLLAKGKWYKALVTKQSSTTAKIEWLNYDNSNDAVGIDMPTILRSQATLVQYASAARTKANEAYTKAESAMTKANEAYSKADDAWEAATDALGKLTWYYSN